MRINLGAAMASQLIGQLNDVCRERDRERDKAADLRKRIDRTLAYIDELQPTGLSSDARLTLDAVRRSLITPVGKPSSDHA